MQEILDLIEKFEDACEQFGNRNPFRHRIRLEARKALIAAIEERFQQSETPDTAQEVIVGVDRNGNILKPLSINIKSGRK